MRKTIVVAALVAAAMATSAWASPSTGRGINLPAWNKAGANTYDGTRTRSAFGHSGKKQEVNLRRSTGEDRPGPHAPNSQTKPDAKAPKEPAKRDAKAPKEQVKPGAKAPREQAKPGAKAPKEQAKPSGKGPHDHAKPSGKGPQHHAKPGAKAPKEQAKPGGKRPSVDHGHKVGTPKKVHGGGHNPGRFGQSHRGNFKWHGRGRH